MTLLYGPSYLQANLSTDRPHTAAAAPTAGAGFIILRAENFVGLSGNGAWAARLYQYNAAVADGVAGLPSGGTQVGSQQGTFSNTSPVNVVWDASLIAAGKFALGFILPSTSFQQGFVLSLYDDVGGFPTGLSSCGVTHDPMLDTILAAVNAFHDPMLDEILAAVKKTF